MPCLEHQEELEESQEVSATYENPLTAPLHCSGALQ